MSDVDIAHYYNTGMSWDEFLGQSKKNAERMRTFYDEFDFEEDSVAFFNSRTPLQVLAIGEDWCSDVAQNLAMLARIADEVPGMELAVVGREDNAELMETFLTNGKRRIPAVGFYDMTFREVGRWTGRCASADVWVKEFLAGRDWGDVPEAELVTFNQEYDAKFRDVYAQETLSEWKQVLEAEDF